MKTISYVIFALLSIPFSTTFGQSTSTSAKIVTFDVPGAGTKAHTGTYAYQINNTGTIVGTVTDQNDFSRGFLRSASGLITVFNCPSAVATFAYSVNTPGSTTGHCYSAVQSQDEGYIRDASGIFTIFEAPGASNGTFPASIDDQGDVTGFYSELTGTAHGFVRAASGEITTFDAPGAGTGTGRGTHPVAINSVAGIVGYFFDQAEIYHGFVRDPSGTFTTIDGEGAVWTLPSGINTAGFVIGTYLDATLVSHGFLRSPSGKIATIDVPAPCALTTPASINTLGAIGGSCNVTAPLTGFNARVGFVRSPAGEFKAFAVPGSLETEVTSISDTQQATGAFYMGSISNTGARGFVITR